jgi:hypothetical protein
MTERRLRLQLDPKPEHVLGYLHVAVGVSGVGRLVLRAVAILVALVVARAGAVAAVEDAARQDRSRWQTVGSQDVGMS